MKKNHIIQMNIIIINYINNGSCIYIYIYLYMWANMFAAQKTIVIFFFHFLFKSVNGERKRVIFCTVHRKSQKNERKKQKQKKQINPKSYSRAQSNTAFAEEARTDLI